MSSIASNAEDLILNADGGSSTVKFKIDGTQKASIDSSGNLIVSGSVTANPSGNDPAIKVGYDGTQGHASTIEFGNGYTQSFEIGMNDTWGNRDFWITETSTGASTDATNPKYRFKGDGDGVFSISDKAGDDVKVSLHTNGDTYFTGGNVGIGTASPTRTVDINHASTAPDLRLGCDGNDAPMIIMDSDITVAADPLAHIVFRWNNTDAALISAYAGADTTNKDDGGLTFKTRTSGSALATRLDLTADGRGLSQFTAKAWVNFNGTGTVAIRDSHNVSSITDAATGKYHINFSNNMANANYCAVGTMSVNEDGGSSTTDSDCTLRSFSTSKVNFYVYVEAGSGWTDPAICTALIFGD